MKAKREVFLLQCSKNGFNEGLIVAFTLLPVAFLVFFVLSLLVLLCWCGCFDKDEPSAEEKAPQITEVPMESAVVSSGTEVTPPNNVEGTPIGEGPTPEGPPYPGQTDVSGIPADSQ